MPIDPVPVKVLHYTLETPLDPQESSMGDFPIKVRTTLKEENGRTLYLTMSVGVFAETLKLFHAYARKHGIATPRQL